MPRLIDKKTLRLVALGSAAAALATLFGAPADATHTRLKVAVDCAGGPAACGEWTEPFYVAEVVPDPACLDNHGFNAFREVASGLCVQDPDALSQAAVNATLLKNGNVFFYSGVDTTGTDWPLENPNLGKARVWNPRTGDVSIPAPEDGGGGDMFCSANTTLPDGRVLIVGGTEWETPVGVGLPGTGELNVILRGRGNARIFDPDSNTFTQVDNMAFRRWYPSLYQMADNRYLVLSGSESLGDATTWVDAVEAIDGDEPEAGAWDNETSRRLPYYPRMHLLPGNKLYYSGVGALYAPFGEESEFAEDEGWYYDPAQQEWESTGPFLFGARQHGYSILLPLSPDKDYRTEVITTNGTVDRTLIAVNNGEIADFGTASDGQALDRQTNGGLDSTLNAAERSLIAPSNFGRWFPTLTQLPDGNALLTGGASIDHVLSTIGSEPAYFLNAELLEPDGSTAALDAGLTLAGLTSGAALRGKWNVMAPAQIPRGYHSTALLLADGRVATMGHVPIALGLFNQVGGEGFLSTDETEDTTGVLTLGFAEKRVEIFSPPYLFRGTRPVINRAPARAAYGETFSIATGEAMDVESVVMIRPGSVTHATDFEQRTVELEIVGRSSGNLRVVAPPSASIAPEGHYMLFINKGTIDGPIPSVASFVRIG